MILNSLIIIFISLSNNEQHYKINHTNLLKENNIIKRNIIPDIYYLILDGYASYASLLKFQK